MRYKQEDKPLSTCYNKSMDAGRMDIQFSLETAAMQEEMSKSYS
jgi:hypothetical protein